MIDIRVQEVSFDPGAELTAFTAARSNAGAIVSFSGIVRDVADGLRHMEIEHFPGMTEAALTDHARTAMERFELSGVLVVHRHGRLFPGEIIMMVATASAHRAAAFQGAQFLMDYLKSRAPFWKKEVTASGSSWVEAKTEDEDALDRWTQT